MSIRFFARPRISPLEKYIYTHTTAHARYIRIKREERKRKKTKREGGRGAAGSMQEKEREEKGRKKKRQESEGRIPERGLRDQVMLTGARSSHTYLLISARTQLHVRARRPLCEWQARATQANAWLDTWKRERYDEPEARRATFAESFRCVGKPAEKQ